MHADHIVVATGGVPIVPGFCRGAEYVLAQDILEAKVQAGAKCLVIGGGLVGSETAEFLADQGKAVTIVELRDTIAADMEYKDPADAHAAPCRTWRGQHDGNGSFFPSVQAGKCA